MHTACITVFLALFAALRAPPLAQPQVGVWFGLLFVLAGAMAYMRWGRRLDEALARNRLLEGQEAGHAAEMERREADSDVLKERLTTVQQEAEAHHVQGEQQRLQFREQARRLEEALACLLNLDGLKSQFFANISHELRTSLTLLLGPVQDALAAPGVQPLDHRQLVLMHHNGLRLLCLVNQILDLTKVEAGSMQLRVCEADVVPFLRSLVAAFASQAERDRVTLSFHTAQAGCPLYFDADKLEKVVANLLSNALKFSTAGGKVRVALRTEQAAGGAVAVIEVKDTGQGIPPEAQQHVFDRFYQADGSATRRHEGTGIGLTLAKELVALHGGRIELESEVGFGTRFFVKLPLGRDHLRPEDVVEAAVPAMERAPWMVGPWLVEGHKEPAAAMLQEASDSELDGEAPLVLLVENNADVRHYLRQQLAPHYRLAEAVDGEEGLEQARRLRPALVIADVMMPRLDGFALCHALKTDPELDHIPVVLLTARADERSKLEGLATGADDYLSKPFDAGELRLRVQNLIELRHALRARFSGEVRLGPSDVVVSSQEGAFLVRVREVVEQSMGNCDFGVDQLAEAVGLSVRQLQRRLKKAANLSAAGYVRMMRLERATQLLAQRAGTVAEVAYRVGFKNADHFSRLFHQVYGIVPSQYSIEASST